MYAVGRIRTLCPPLISSNFRLPEASSGESSVLGSEFQRNCDCHELFNIFDSHFRLGLGASKICSRPQLIQETAEIRKRSEWYSAVCHSLVNGSVETSLEEPHDITDLSPVSDTAKFPDLWLFNSKSRKKELFKTKVAGKVGMYVCGVTVYDFSHIGHARVYVAFDVLLRYLQHIGYEVNYVRNFTDIDDKIINRAAKLGEDPLSLSSRFCAEFHADMAALNCLPPTAEPKVTDHISDIIDMISKIIENRLAYAIDGDVFFEVAKFSDYGSLSGRRSDEMKAGERVQVDQRKRNPADFALWKSAKPGEVSWSSPWGPGRPGWHIECSAMSLVHLGPFLDIHGGGMDLIFPHHENELAQSRAADSAANVGFWVHNGFVNIDSEKMSKSLGNFFTIRQVLEIYHPMALRYFLLGTQYRSPINYSSRQLDLASDRLFYLYQTLEDSRVVLGSHKATDLPASPEVKAMSELLLKSFHSSMGDDLHTGLALSSFAEALKAMNDFLHTKKGRKDKSRIESMQVLQSSIVSLLDLLGLPNQSFKQLLDELKGFALKRSGVTGEELSALMSERVSARKEKDFDRSDAIRQRLASKGIMLMDDGDGTDWRPVPAMEQDS